MNRLKLVLIPIVALLGAGAFLLMKRRPVETPIAPAAPVMMVLSATRDLPSGTRVEDGDLEWVKMTDGGETEDRIISSSPPTSNFKEQAIDSYVRTPIGKGEQIRRSRLAKTSLMAMMLAPGHRAVAIDVAPNTTAGGFILPNDRVDVLRTYRNADATQEAGRDIFSTDIILENVRVLAIGAVSEKKGSDATVTGPTATLELTPRAAEIALMGQKTGQLSLALRPMEDARKQSQHETYVQDRATADGATIVRRGVVSTLRAR